MSIFRRITSTILGTTCLSAIGLLSLTILVGCGKYYNPASVNHSNSTNCDKLKGYYYDPKIASCVQPTSDHQALVLNAYRRVQTLADTTSTELEYAIYPTDYLTAADAESLWTYLREHGAKANLVAAVLPDDTIYDPLPAPDGTMPHQGAPTTKSWSGGVNFSTNLLWHSWNDTPSSTVVGMMLSVLAREEVSRSRPQLRAAVADNFDFRISQIGVSAPPRLMLEFWNRHLDKVEAVQPMVDAIDKLTPRLGPVRSLSEGR
ncbi:MAG: hypothetical protein PHS79_02835 [Patescibacteria group bacterium]|nr:hypothetical protein [Patescibacteria group bacterium]